MNNGPEINRNPLKLSVGLLVASYIFGEFVIPKYHLAYFFNLFGVLGLIVSVALFITGFTLFKSYEEDPKPNTSTKRLIKTGIYAYTRNPIYLSFVLFFLSMFLVFENVMYFLSALGLAVWLHHWVIKVEENYLHKQLNEEYDRYKQAVKRWLFF